MLDSRRCQRWEGHVGVHRHGPLEWGGTLRDRLGRAPTANEAAGGASTPGHPAAAGSDRQARSGRAGVTGDRQDGSASVLFEVVVDLDGDGLPFMVTAQCSCAERWTSHDIYGTVTVAPGGPPRFVAGFMLDLRNWLVGHAMSCPD